MLQKPLLLVIDDDEAVRRSCRAVLAGDLYEVAEAADGRSGLELIRDLRPDVVFIDLKMPGLSGIDVLREIGDIDPGIIPIIITGYATIESAVEATKLGAFDYLTKPFSVDKLRLLTRRAVQRRRLLQEATALREETERVQRRFISLVSHQMKAPLAAISEYLEVLLGGIVGELNDEQHDILQRTHQRLDGLLNLIRDWLSFARVPGRSMLRDTAPVNLTGILAGIVSLLEPLAGRQQVELRCTTSPELMVAGDPDLLREAFTNLISNAIAYNREGGEVEISCDCSPTRAVVKIRDTGIGINPEELPYIFDEFHRSERVHHIPGTGLGLSIVKRIVEAHRGRVSVESRVDVGSTFSVELPVPRGVE